MITPLILSQKYEEYKPILGLVSKKVGETVIRYCEQHNYAFTSRIKSLDSLAEKIETGRYKCWTDLDDLYACTIIVPTLSDEGKVIEYFESKFEKVKLTKRGQTKKAPDTFRFDSPRLICRLPRPTNVQSAGLSIYDIKFEIQVRSAFEHAWSVTTHALTYKSDIIDWKRLRLTSQIKAAVEQLDTLILSFEHSTPFILENPWPELKDKKKIGNKIDSLVRANYIPSELLPKDMSRFCDNFYAILKSNNKEKSVSDSLSIIEQHIIRIGAKRVPRSISLLQFFFTILVENKFLNISTEESNKHYYHITEELNSLFPEITSITNKFDYFS